MQHMCRFHFMNNEICRLLEVFKCEKRKLVKLLIDVQQ